MFCHICGTQISEGARFCHNCGTKAVYGDDAAAPQDMPAFGDEPAAEEKTLRQATAWAVERILMRMGKRPGNMMI